jgi:hypothetical protein
MMQDLFREGRDIDAARAQGEDDRGTYAHGVPPAPTFRFLPLILAVRNSCDAVVLAWRHLLSVFARWHQR